MLLVKIWPLPKISELQLKALYDEIVAVFGSMPELEINARDVVIGYPSDMMLYGLGTDIVVEVDKLFDTPKRTPAVRSRLRAELGNAVKHAFPNAKVECFLGDPFRPTNENFWSSAMHSIIRDVVDGTRNVRFTCQNCNDSLVHVDGMNIIKWRKKGIGSSLCTRLPSVICPISRKLRENSCRRTCNTGGFLLPKFSPRQGTIRCTRVVSLRMLLPLTQYGISDNV